MKNRMIKFNLLGLIFVIFVIFTACEKYEEPPTIYNHETEYATSPVINSIVPADSAIAGVREIIISGSNFAVNGVDTNWVKIGGIDAKIKSLTANEIVVYRPSSFGEGLNITVTIPTAISVASVEDYKVEEPLIEHGDFSTNTYPLRSIESDKNDNLYIGTRREIFKLSTDGIFLEPINSKKYPSAFAKITCLKFGADGFLYAAISKKEIYKIDINTGEQTEYVKLKKNSEKLAFDSNGNLYAAKKDGIFVVQSDLSITETLLYDDETINELRVYDGYLYVAIDEKLSRNQIIDAQGTLGDAEVILDLADIPEFGVGELLSFNVDEDGRFILAIQGHVAHSLFVLEKNGAVAPFYNSNIIPMAVEQIIYGNDRFMYLSRGSLNKDSIRVFKMGMDKIGATNIGR